MLSLALTFTVGESKVLCLPPSLRHSWCVSYTGAHGHEVLVACNVSDQSRSDSVIADAALHKPGETTHFLYGKSGGVTVQSTPDGAFYAQLALGPRQFVTLA